MLFPRLTVSAVGWMYSLEYLMALTILSIILVKRGPPDDFNLSFYISVFGYSFLLEERC
jgi:hypothetical protein